MTDIDGLQLQELRETLEEALEGVVAPLELDDRDARLILALMDERDARANEHSRQLLEAITYSSASQPQYHVNVGRVRVPGPGWYEACVRERAPRHGRLRRDQRRRSAGLALNILDERAAHHDEEAGEMIPASAVRELRDEYAGCAESADALCTSIAESESDPELARDLNTLAEVQRSVVKRLDAVLAAQEQSDG